MKKEQYEASKTNIAPATLGEFFTLCINLILQEFNLDPVEHVVADPDPVKLRAKQRARGIRQQVNAAQNQPDVSPIQSPLRRREPPGPQQMSPPPQPQQPQNQPIARVRGRGRGARGTVGTGRLSPIRERTISPVPGTSGLSNRGRGRVASPSISPITGTRGHGRGGSPSSSSSSSSSIPTPRNRTHIPPPRSENASQASRTLFEDDVQGDPSSQQPLPRRRTNADINQDRPRPLEAPYETRSRSNSYRSRGNQ